MRPEIATRLAQCILEEALPVGRAVGLERLAGARLLVTGASGLIGLWLLASLPEDPRRRPAQVTAVTRGEPAPYFGVLAERKKARVLSGDLTQACFRQTLPVADVIVHAAGYGQPGRFLADPRATLALNVCASIDLLALLDPGGRYLYLSTSEVYSGLPPGAHEEEQIGTTNTDHPRASYIEAKRAGEVLCHAAGGAGITARAARVALAYGPGVRLDDARVLNAFIRRGLSGAVTLADHGQALRTYCYAADTLEMLWRILLDGRRVVYNVGGKSRTTIADLAGRIGALTNAPVVMPQTAAPLSGSPGEVCLSLARIEEDFGKRDFVPLEAGLTRTVEWLRLLAIAEEEKR
jgi:nucleoside-diphosphate-sugar epimerase